ncbi:nucleoside hydrolase [Nesterenkonia natronophila]|uniref:Nucleoside hydrolase n=1 Tax=Nesterenkonia natronophila TaxID=2174932 RepID=A0A3A4FJJ7_9MICC|nr:nucleoside hydrolase [Nesterenkonia natronophila]RJN32555.1 nucleoside hydrolase [Nesterenkonia natronophila]
MIPLFLDCDPGIDDAVALGYMVCQTDVEVVGIAATGGNVPTAQTVRNALSWLELAGRSNIAVHPGAQLPLAHKAPYRSSALTPPVYADDTHGPVGTGHAALPTPRTTPPPVSAAEAWVNAAHTHPGELIGVVTGPCTNLAMALELEPDLPRLTKRIFVMGGAFNYRGNTKPTTEWNIDHDPEAAACVFNRFAAAQHLPVVGPIEATEAVVITPERLGRILTGTSDPRWRTWLEHLGEALRFYFEFHASDGHGYVAQVHDPYVLAAALQWARHPDPTVPIPWAESTRAAIDVELEGSLTRGETVADWLGRWGAAPNAELVRRIDAESFLHHLETTLTRGPTYDHAR